MFSHLRGLRSCLKTPLWRDYSTFVQRERKACWQGRDGGQLGKGKTVAKPGNECQPVGCWAMNSILAPHSAARTPTGKASWFTWAALPPDARAPSWGKTTGPSLARKCRATCLYEAWPLSIFVESGVDQRWEGCLQMWGPGKVPWQL